MKTIALIGNPNCGKTTLFNKLTNGQEYVGNWSGVTVQKKQGLLKIKEKSFTVVDLPGVYSLSSYSEDEIVTRNYLLYEKPDLIINIIDATNIERNLYLTSQLIETSIPMILVLNMIDEVEKSKIIIDYDLMSEIISLPIIPMSAAKSSGIGKLFDVLYEFGSEKLFDKNFAPKSFLEGKETFFLAQKLANNLSDNNIPCNLLMAMKIIEGDKKFPVDLPENVLHSIDIPQKQWDIIIATERYNFIDDLCKKCIHKNKSDKLSVSNMIDKVLINKYLAFPIFFVIMFIIFQLTFSIGGGFFSNLVEDFIYNHLSVGLANLFKFVNLNKFVSQLIINGIIPGVGTILTFLPQVTILFFFLSLIEDSGYVARAAFIMDKPLRKIGLSGKSFVPIILGFGCSVPAILSTRTLDNPKDKKLTIMLAPFISCSARMPLYAMFGKIFFAKNTALIIFCVYTINIFVAALASIILNNTVLRGKTSNFIMELPPYRFPTLKNLSRNVYYRVKDSIHKIATVILLASAFIWLMKNFDLRFCQITNDADSILGIIGKLINPIFIPLGFGDWRLSVALLTGIFAKETIVSSINILFGNSAAALSSILSPLNSFCYMIFVSLYLPCIVTISVIKQEIKSWRWTFFSLLFQISTAWLTTFFIYKIANLIFRH